jgi:hypothetical protein
MLTVRKSSLDVILRLLKYRGRTQEPRQFSLVRGTPSEYSIVA